MATIDIGAGATNMSTYFTGNRTRLDKTNPANDSGILYTMSFWAESSMTSVKCGTFYGSDTSWQVRDYENIGNIASGSKQTFTGLSCNVSTDDILGYYSPGSAEYLKGESTGGSGILYSSVGSDGFSETISFSLLNNYMLAMEAASQETGKKWNGITISKWNGTTVSKLNGV